MQEICRRDWTRIDPRETNFWLLSLDLLFWTTISVEFPDFTSVFPSESISFNVNVTLVSENFLFRTRRRWDRNDHYLRSRQVLTVVKMNKRRTWVALRNEKSSKWTGEDSWQTGRTRGSRDFVPPKTASSGLLTEHTTQKSRRRRGWKRQTQGLRSLSRLNCPYLS